jgi:cellulose synthase/poly-beta-1,6-N-acetylglucosamine synthase-like glycosyltransferase
MMSEYKLSVVVPIAKMSGRLENLKSWLEPALRLRIQVVLVHDMQDDLTSVELHDLVSKYPFDNLVLLEKTLNSPGLARNYGRTVTQGDWVTFWDSDDLPTPHRYLEMIEEAEITQKQIAIGGYQTQNVGNKVIGSTHFPTSDVNSIFRHPGMWRMAFKSELIEGSKFSEYKMAEDQLFLAELNLESKQVFFSNKLVYTYFLGSGTQLTNNKFALSNIPYVTTDMAEKIDSGVIWSNLSRLLFLKLCLTQVKHSELMDKVCAIALVLKIIINPFRNGTVIYSFIRYWG